MKSSSKLSARVQVWFLSLVLVGSAQASLITWEAASTTTGVAVNDVRTNGTSVVAINLATGTIASVTLNGVNFSAGTTIFPINAGALSGSLTNAAVAYNPTTYTNLLSTLAYGGGRTNSMNIGGGSLVLGYQYQVQLWFADNRNLVGRENLGMEIGGAPSGNFVTLLSGSRGPAFGQYAVGTFVADGTSQTLYMETADNLASGQMGNLHLNAYQIRFLAVPEPGVAGMIVLGGALVAFSRRRLLSRS